ncbi:N-acetylmuramic acid 6-phosphate etherase [Owenweeksia hongkongensis DSM 17368]|uniref:N-acetylmuramic acid 6-phosphate etherase n=1 Tax=Owenweeksia hongkongensis (strain DSM 17368 / CIP 108786 / JCM 12287 / NRRL B-23963 / UST20020801) TaxID=926562 RepID=G8R3E8_OWEHD|nr:N-acetylmuramic acid 6-phosphate etherase [Owenweeksia hongkongensis]AEV31969.1 N-acetylmuramic acid 6-phosphate etherase [Owenweeksia hongkongensis DSM 17368]
MKTTESDSLYNHLEKMSTQDLLTNINNEDQKVALAVQTCIPEIEKLVDVVVEKMKVGGRLFYIGAGTSGRLGILDASELPPTFGADPNMVVGLIAGGDTAIRKAVEFAEDDTQGALRDLGEFDINTNDMVLGIAASGTTPYVIGGLKECRKRGIATACITCNADAPVIAEADFPIVAVVGPEFVTGSTRMKAGTAQKLILNMISTTTMIKLGRVKGNKMVDMQLSNNKLVDRGTRMIMSETGTDAETAERLLKEHGGVRKAVEAFLK